MQILIVFTAHYLAYSPTTLNLYDALSKEFDVTILSFEQQNGFENAKIEGRKIRYIKPSLSIARGLRLKAAKNRILGWFKRKKNDTEEYSAEAIQLISAIKQFSGEVIAVDFFALYCAQKAGKNAHLLSLEIFDDDYYRRSIDKNLIKSVIIQSRERLNYIFPDWTAPVFIIPNSPFHIDQAIPADRQKHKLLFCGTALKGFGIFDCLNFLRQFPPYELLIKGSVPDETRNRIEDEYPDLFRSKRVIIDENYLSSQLLNQYISKYRIGFVFYDTSVQGFNRFNYRTGVSGKLFQYYNAGIPVIASNLPGLSSVKEYNAGVMIDSLNPKEIKTAIDIIEADYQNLAINAKKASKDFDFGKHVSPFIDYMKKVAAQGIPNE